MYEVWFSEGDGSQRHVRCRTLEDANRCAGEYNGTGSIAIRKPDGGWVQFQGHRNILSNRRRASRYTVDVTVEVAVHPGIVPPPPPLDCGVRDASNDGLRLVLPAADRQLAPEDLVWVTIPTSYGRLGVAARIAWRSDIQVGAQLLWKGDAASRSYRSWLKRTAIALRSTP